VLQSRGIDAKFIEDCGFRDTTSDTVWMSEAGARGWVALSRDEGIRRRQSEQSVVRRAKLRLFLLQTKKINGNVIVEVFTHHWERIEAFARQTPAPFIAGVDRTKVALLKPLRGRRGGR
jgi:hypothetical protein